MVYMGCKTSLKTFCQAIHFSEPHRRAKGILMKIRYAMLFTAAAAAVTQRQRSSGGDAQTQRVAAGLRARCLYWYGNLARSKSCHGS